MGMTAGPVVQATAAR